MLRLNNLNIGYNDSAPVVSSIDAELSDGCFCCLLGRNGTGKSTLLRTIAGLQHPLTGTIERPDSIGIVLTAIPNLLNTKVREMVAYGRLAHTGIWGRLHNEDYAMADEAIRLVGIEDISDRLLSTLSDGEKQKTMIARAIAQQSPLLLLDEPSAFLDYPSRRELMHLLQDLAHIHRKTILLSTHDVELAASSADVLWIINDKVDAKVCKAQLEDMAAHGLQAVCFHPEPPEFRPVAMATRLDLPYLSKPYFNFVHEMIKKCAALGMHYWLYDEGGWPSGNACGQVMAANPKRFRQMRIAKGPDGHAFIETLPAQDATGRYGYPNLLTLSYDNARTRASGTLEALEALENRSELELFAEFYEVQNNGPMTEAQREYCRRIFEELKEAES